MYKKLFTLILAVVLALGLAAYAETDTQTPAAVPDAAMVLVSVDGTDITFGEITQAFQYLASMYQSMGIDVSSADVQQSLMSSAVSMLIQEKVLLYNAGKLGLDVLSDEQMAELKTQAEATYENMIKSYSSYFAASGLTEDEVRANTIEYLTDEGHTVDSLIDDSKTNIIYQNVQAYAAKDVSVTDEDVKAAYDEGVASAQEKYAQNASAYDSDTSSGATIFVVPEGYRAVKHILVKVADAAELKTLKAELAELNPGDEGYQEKTDRVNEIMAAVQPKLDEILSRIDAGEDFQALIDEYGEDGGMKSGPTAETGYVLGEGTARYVAEFKDASMALEKVGDISEPTLSDFGFHIIRYDSDVPARVVPFEEVKDALKASLVSARESEAYNQLLNSWLNAANITYPQATAE